jgi:hypothetical protein
MALGRQFVVRVDGTNQLNKKFSDMVDFGRIKLGNLTKDSAMQGASMAASMAPNRTGHLIQAIGYGKTEDKSWVIQSKQPKGERNRPYHLWMHGLGKYPQVKNYIHSGTPNYMEVTYDNLTSIYPKKVISELQKTMNK